jgi:hypothetical protein
MTTGSFSHGSGYPSASALYQKSWTGGDGKKEVVGGREREKWNNYTCSITRETPLVPSSPLQFVTAGGSSGLGGVVLPWTGADELQLQSKLVSTIRGHEFNLAVNVAQSKQLVSMCVLNIRKVSRSLRYLQRGDFASAARQLGIQRAKRSKLGAKDVSGRWLELQYGWLPAIKDTYEAGKAYEALTSIRSSRVVVRRSKKSSYEGSAAPTNYSCPGIARTSKKIVYEMEENLSQPRSLGLEDPLSVVWEIIPYSFVIDWFLPVGSYLENLAVIPFLRGRFCSSLSQMKQAAFGYAINPTYKGYRRAYFHRQVTRAVSTGLNVQRPQFKSLGLALSAKHIFNAVALGHQRLR